MLALSARLHRLNGGRRAGRLLLWLGAAASSSASRSAPASTLCVRRASSWRTPCCRSLGLLLALAVLQLGMGAEVWRYHGAEHKAVNAYEARADLGDVGRGRRLQPHPRPLRHEPGRSWSSS